jgi:hypothetical protein
MLRSLVVWFSVIYNVDTETKGRAGHGALHTLARLRDWNTYCVSAGVIPSNEVRHGQR